MQIPIRIVFVCTGNACRSQMAEALMRHVGGQRFEAASAGSNPAGFIHRLATETMTEMGVSMVGQRSKGWDDLATSPTDVVITLCDHAAGQPCPVLPGRPVMAHWSLPDPSFHPGTDQERRAEARRVAEAIRKRAERLAGLPLETMTPEAMQTELKRLADLW